MPAKKIPQRQCIGCRECRDKKDLVRIVKTPENEVVIDRTGKRNGRGAYLCDNRECLVRARKGHALDRSFRMQVPDEIYEELERQWENDTE